MFRRLPIALIFACIFVRFLTFAESQMIEVEFNIDSGDASETLVIFAKQSFQSLIFEMDEVKGVFTQTIEGGYQPSEALKALLEGTSLGFIEDADTGAFAIIRSKAEATELSENPLGGHPEDPQNENPKQHNNIMKDKLRSPFSKLIGGFMGFLVATSSPMMGQDGSMVIDNEDVYELSPFVISTDEQVGYLATNTLAGSRIKTDLKDLGAAISVVTAELMEDTQSTNAQELFVNLTSLEIGGTQGNLSTANFTGGGSSWGGINTDRFDINPQSTARVRGLERPNFTRGYFSTSIPIDAYNTGTITVSRGANSLLFGLGAAGGVIDAGLNEAILGQNQNKIELTVDNNGSVRGSLSIARTLLEDRLAVRVDALNSNTKYQQDPAFEDSERYYVAINAVLLENDGIEWLGKTSLKAKFEFGDMSSTPPSPTLPINGFQSFFEPPSVNTQQYTGQPMRMDYALSFEDLRGRWQKWAVLDQRPYADPNSSTGISIPNPRNDGFGGWGRYWESANVLMHYAPSFDGNPGIGSSDGSVGYQSRYANKTHLNADGDVFNARWKPLWSYATGAYETQATNFVMPSLTDRNIFDYRNHLITGNSKRIEREFDNKQIGIEQMLFGGKGGVEFVYASESYDRSVRLPFSGNIGRAAALPVAIDLSTHLPSGEANPNVGKPFMTAHSNETRERFEDRENMRMVAFYNHNFRDHMGGKLGEILGSHRFTGLLQQDDFKVETRNSDLFLGYAADPSQTVAQDALWWWQQPGHESKRVISRMTRPVYRIYLSDESLVGKEMSQVRLNPVLWNQPRAGDIYKFQYLDAKQPIDNGDWQNNYGTKDYVLNRYYNGAGIARTKVKSKAFAWQSYLFSDHIVGLIGWRTDEIENWNRIQESVRNVGYDINVPRHNVLQKESTVTEGSTTTWSIVAHVPEKIIERLPVSSASFHIGEGENFSAIAERNDIYGNSIENPSGKTKEIGFSLGFADNKWRVKVNRFETTSAFSGVSRVTNNVLSNFAQYSLQRYTNQTGPEVTGKLPFEEQAAAAAGFSSYEDVKAAIIASIPEQTRTLLNPRLDEDGIWEFDRIDNLADTQSVRSEGYEIELVGNPTANWRVMLNASKIEAVTSDSITPTAAWLDQVLTNWEAAGLTHLPLGTLIEPGIYTAGHEVTFIEQYRSVIGGVQTIKSKDGNLSQELREWRINFINSYDFLDGVFKGFGVGCALRYQSGVATGYSYRLNDNDVMIPDVSNPYMGDAELNGDVWFSYKKRLGNKVDWKIQLNIRNAIGSQDNIVIYTNPDGTDALFRNPPERVWTLRNTFSF